MRVPTKTEILEYGALAGAFALLFTISCGLGVLVWYIIDLIVYWR